MRWTTSSWGNPAANSIEVRHCVGRRTFMPFDYGMRSLMDPFVVASLLARSDDGIYFPDLEWVFETPNPDTWRGRRARLNSTIPGRMAGHSTLHVQRHHDSGSWRSGFTTLDGT